MTFSTLIFDNFTSGCLIKELVSKVNYFYSLEFHKVKESSRFKVSQIIGDFFHLISSVEMRRRDEKGRENLTGRGRKGW